MTWKIEPVPHSNGWWLFTKGADDVWWHVYDNWSPVFPALDAVFAKIKERKV